MRGLLSGILASLAFVLAACPAWAVEYRLRMASVIDDSLAAFLSSGELKDGASGPGLDRLEATLDRGEFPPGALLYDRPLQAVIDARVRAYAAVPVRAEILKPGINGFGWEEARWEGKPGERSLWVISASNTRYQQLSRLALQGSGPLRQFQPQFGPVNGKRLLAVTMPLNFLWAEEERGTLWNRWLTGNLDLGQGLGAVVGVNHAPLFPDVAYLVIEQGPQPTIYSAILSWRRRQHSDRGNVESAADGSDRFR